MVKQTHQTPLSSPFFGMEGKTIQEINTEDHVTSPSLMVNLLAGKLTKVELVGLFALLDEDSEHTMRLFRSALERKVRLMAPEVFSVEKEQDPTIDQDPSDQESEDDTSLPWDEEDEALAQSSFPVIEGDGEDGLD